MQNEPMEPSSTTEPIDNGKPFYWGKTSEDYARYRDIYPADLFDKLHAFGIGARGRTIVDLGTGTGVKAIIGAAARPRNGV